LVAKVRQISPAESPQNKITKPIPLSHVRHGSRNFSYTEFSIYCGYAEFANCRLMRGEKNFPFSEARIIILFEALNTCVY